MLALSFSRRAFRLPAVQTPCIVPHRARYAGGQPFRSMFSGIRASSRTQLGAAELDNIFASSDLPPDLSLQNLRTGIVFNMSVGMKAIKFVQPIFNVGLAPDVLLVRDTRRYKEFAKNGAKLLYMPCYEKEELMAAAEFIKTDANFSSPLKELYKPESVTERFERYGGIARRVLVKSQDALDAISVAQASAIQGAPKINFYDISRTETNPTELSSTLLTYDIDKTSFKILGSKWVSDRVREEVDDVFRRIAISKLREILIEDDAIKDRNTACGKVFEILFTKLVTTEGGIAWHQRSNGSTKQGDNSTAISWEPYVLNLKRVEKNSRCYSAMEDRVLYYPAQANFPAVECFYRDHSANSLVAFQITRQRKGSKEMALSALESFISKGVELPADATLQLVLVPMPARAEEIEFNFNGENSTMAAPSSYTVLKVPDDYGYGIKPAESENPRKEPKAPTARQGKKKAKYKKQN